MDDKSKPLPWDYFLTNYERDLLRLPLEDAMRKYPEIERERVEADLIELKNNQIRHEQ
jgi:hypothetical protein